MTLPPSETPRPAEPPAAETATPRAPAQPSPESPAEAPAPTTPAPHPAAPAAEAPADRPPAEAPASPAGPAPDAAAPAPAAAAPASAAAAPAAPLNDHSSALLSEPDLPVAPTPAPGEPPAPLQGAYLTPPPTAAPAPPAPPPMATGVFPGPPAPPRPSKAGVVTLAIALAVVAVVAGTFAYLYTQAADEADARAAEIEELLAAEEELKAENSRLVSDLAGLQLTADDYEACQTAFEAYDSLEFEGDIDPGASNLEEIFTEEYIAYQNELAELYREVVVKCSP